VATVAEGRRFGCFTTTEIELFGFIGDVLNRGDIGPLMCAVTEWLAVASTTGTPVVGFALLDSYAVRAICSSNRFVHNTPLYIVVLDLNFVQY
jgi:hypothetical protein